MNITTLGIDLAKNIFQLHGVDEKGKVVLKKTLTRHKLVEFTAQLPPCRIVVEACGGANFWARKFKEYGHNVQIISPQFVRPFVKGNKNDRNDAEAIVEAASRPTMRFVSPKTVVQQDIQSLLRVRENCIKKLPHSCLSEPDCFITQKYLNFHISVRCSIENEFRKTINTDHVLSDFFHRIFF